MHLNFHQALPNLKHISLSILLLLEISQMLSGQNIGIEKLGPLINTDTYQEINPLVSDDGNTLYFTRTGSPDFEKYLLIDGEDIYTKIPETKYNLILGKVYEELGDHQVRNPHRSAFNQDVWMARTFDGKSFEYVFHPGPPLNNALPNSICSETPSKDEFVIINQYPASGGMKKGFSSISRISDSLWSLPKPIVIQNYYNKSDIVSFAMSRDGRTAILSLKRDDSLGENDLYLTHINPDSTWSTPENITSLNSPYNDISPYLSDDMRTLFFASNRPGTMGGFDIFMCTRNTETWDNWSEPKPMIEPINSSQDDVQPFYNSATGYLYFATRRFGSSDIYRSKIGDPNPLKINILGRAVDSKTLRPVPASIYIGNADEDNYKKVLITENGEFTIVAGKNDKLKIFPYKDSYLSEPIIVDVSKLQLYANSTEMNIYIDRKVVDGRINLSPIYFIQSTAQIQTKSLPELERLSQLLKNNPGISISIEGHTDNQGKEEDLQKLSEDRAIAVKDFLITKGIKEARLSTKGWGAKQAVNANKSLEEREQNRRVEFIITKI